MYTDPALEIVEIPVEIDEDGEWRAADVELVPADDELVELELDLEPLADDELPLGDA